VSASYRVMGVVNTTPDSFSDGGRFLDPSSAIAQARRLIDEGADIVDIGGESTRPGAEPVSETEELQRVMPVIEGIAASGGETFSVDLPGGSTATAAAAAAAAAQISIDTVKAVVARAALGAGASIVNDVSALRADPDMASVVAEARCECVLMHMLGEPRTMQRGVSDASYNDVVDDVRAFLEERLEYAVRAGIREERIVLDPGIGFGKTVAHNLELLRRLDELVALGRPVLVGTSRKSFIGRIMAADTPASAEGGEPGRQPAQINPAQVDPAPVEPAQRLPGTIATNVLAYERGARWFRVHDVAPVRGALAVTAATLNAR
jgi:dihydropteroate synthase